MGRPLKNMYMRTYPKDAKVPKAPSSILTPGTVISTHQGPTKGFRFRSRCITHGINYVGIVTRTGKFKVKIMKYKRYSGVTRNSGKKWFDTQGPCVLIDKINNIWVPKAAFVKHLSEMHRDTSRVRIVGEEAKKTSDGWIRTARDLPTMLDPQVLYDVIHYTSKEGLAGIKNMMKLLSGPGCYGDWVYLTRYRPGKNPLEIGPTLFDGAGPRLATEGRLNCCIRLEIPGKYLMPCISEDPTHSGFCFNGGRKGAPGKLYAMKGTSARKQKAKAKKAGKGPALEITKEMKPRFYTYRETGQRQMLDGTFRTCGTWRESEAKLFK